MNRNHIILIALIFLAVVCPIVAAVMMATGAQPLRPMSPLTPIVYPTLLELLTSLPDEQPQATMPGSVLILATHAAIETHFAATSAALTAVP